MISVGRLVPQYFRNISVQIAGDVDGFGADFEDCGAEVVRGEDETLQGAEEGVSLEVGPRQTLHPEVGLCDLVQGVPGERWVENGHGCVARVASGVPRERVDVIIGLLLVCSQCT